MAATRSTPRSPPRSTVTGNAISALGSNAGVIGGPSAPAAGGNGSSSQTTNGSQSIGGGNQVNAPVYAPVTVAGNAIAVLGSNALVTVSGSSAPGQPAATAGSSQTTSGRQSIGGGNQVNAPVYAPVTVSGNAISALGSNAGVIGGPSAPAAGGNGSSSQTTNGAQSILGGNQVNAPVYAPVTVSGNAVALLGSNAVVTGGSQSAPPPAATVAPPRPRRVASPSVVATRSTSRSTPP